MKRPNLSAAMEAHDTQAAVAAPLVAQPLEIPSRKPVAMTNRQPGREGKSQVLGWFTRDCKKQLKQIGVDQDKTEQALLTEALNDLFVKYGKPTLA